MRITTPSEVAKQAGNKYLGVLVAAKFARYLNEFPKDQVALQRREAHHQGAPVANRWRAELQAGSPPPLRGLRCGAAGASFLACRAGSPAIRAASSPAA